MPASAFSINILETAKTVSGAIILAAGKCNNPKINATSKMLVTMLVFLLNFNLILSK